MKSSPFGYTPEVPRRLGPILFAAIAAFAQDPYTAFPKNYKLEFENAYVRVSRVKYSPGDRLPEHAHPSLPTVYVYLTDGGPIRFSHQTPKFELERPPVKAGNVRFNRNAQVETHEVEYRGDAPSEFLRIELKTAPAPPHRDARLRADADFPWSDQQIRIARVLEVAAPSRPAVLVDVPRRSFSWFDPQKGADRPGFPPMGPIVVVELLSDPAPR